MLTGRSYQPRRILLLLLLVLGAGVHCHKCYVCGPKQQGFRKGCDQFNSHPELHVENCDTNYLGCSTQFQDGVTIRQCEELKLNDCKVANDVKYCYCRSELCNGPNFANAVPNDDEDMVESSGQDEIEDDEEDVAPAGPKSAGTPLLHNTILLLLAYVLLR